jgi:hypothetical protein
MKEDGVKKKREGWNIVERYKVPAQMEVGS